MLDITLVLGGVVAFLLYLHWKQMRSSSRNAPWAPGWLPIIGNTVALLKNFDSFHDYVRPLTGQCIVAAGIYLMNSLCRWLVFVVFIKGVRGRTGYLATASVFP